MTSADDIADRAPGVTGRQLVHHPDPLRAA